MTSEDALAHPPRAPAEETLPAALERAARHPDAGLRLLDRRGGETWLSWAAIAERAREACGRLQAAGLAPGERVALVSGTVPAFFDAFFGVLLAGGVPAILAPAPPLGRRGEHVARAALLLRSLSPALVLGDASACGLLAGEAREAGARLGASPLEALAGGPARPVEAAPGDVALVQFSSGTTLEPRAVALTHRAVLTQAAILNRLWPDSPGEPHSGVSWLPLHHDMGLIGCLLPALERPGVLTLLPPELFAARPALWLQTLSRHGATLSAAPDFAYRICAERIRDDELRGVDLSRWRVALDGGELVVPAVLRRFRDRFARWGLRAEALTPAYGLAEAALAVTLSPVGEPFRSERFCRCALAERGEAQPREEGVEIVSVGRPVPGFRVEVRDAARSPVPEGRRGRVWACGPSLMAGYLDRPEETARVLADGWLDTGDLGFLRDGELFVVGRATDVLVVRGRNHSPEEIERAVERVEGIRTGGVAAVAHLGDDGEELVLLAEVERRYDGASPSALAAGEGLAAACQGEALAALGLTPSRVWLLPPGALPRTSSGKLRRQEALRRHLAGELPSLSERTDPRRTGPLPE